MKIFDLYQDFVLSGAKVDPSLLEKPLSHIPKPVINTSNNIFLQKIVEMNLYGEDEDESNENSKEPEEAIINEIQANPEESKKFDDLNDEVKSKSDKTNENESTKSNIDSGSTSDSLQESDINPDDENTDELNLNTESANERVDAFLDTLDNISQELRSEGSQISATTYTVTNKAKTNKDVSSSSTSSGSESDDEADGEADEASKSDKSDSIASNRGSDSYQNEIDDTNGSESSDNDEEKDEEEEFFEAAEHFDQHRGPSKSPRDESRQKSSSAMSYHTNRVAYNRWTNMYWNQASQIADYVNHWRFVRQQQKQNYWERKVSEIR